MNSFSKLAYGWSDESVGVRAVAQLLLAMLLAGCVGSKEAGPDALKPEAQLTVRSSAAPASTATHSVSSPPAASIADPIVAMPPIEGAGWQNLFDGQSLAGWKPVDFAGHGEVKVEGGKLIMEMGAMLTGVNGPTNLARWDYEIVMDASKLQGADFFCALTIPVGDACCSLIIGGWGGGVVGISSIDGNDASSNETTTFKGFEQLRWYRVRVKVTHAKIQAWIGAEKVVDVKLEGKRIGMRPGEIEMNQPFGIATYQTTGAIRSVQWRALEPEK